jgi:hypothetical protein
VAVAIIMDFEGSLDQYDQVIEKMGLQDGSTPPGAIFHWVAKTDTGMRVVDVWESRDVFEQFAQEQIGPYTAEVGIEGPPAMTFYDVHNTLPH